MDKDLKRNTIILVIGILILILGGLLIVKIAKDTNSLRYSIPENISIETDETYSNETLNESVMCDNLTREEPERVYECTSELMI